MSKISGDIWGHGLLSPEKIWERYIVMERFPDLAHLH
jgi:hypothetical protein